MRLSGQEVPVQQHELLPQVFDLVVEHRGALLTSLGFLVLGILAQRAFEWLVKGRDEH